MIDCHAVLDPAFTIAPVPRRLFGSFIEHMGRCVYGGVFDPGDPESDRDGYRTDVLALAQELGVTVVRYPGGNFVSGYDWKDGIGPVADRPTRLDLAWRALEPNTFGLHEYMEWSDRCGTEPMLAVNLGTGGVIDAVRLVEYTNFPSGTEFADRRIANGRPDPFGVKLWCLGNEMDGPWQIGHREAHEYGRLAAETAKAMKLVDPTIELVACGSSYQAMPTFGRWESTVLEHTYDYVDYLSLHAYYRKTGQDAVGYLASADAMDEFIHGVVATCDHVAARDRHHRAIDLSFDEWNVERRPFDPEDEEGQWTQRRRIAEDTYTAEDAVVVGNLLISLLRHSDRVKIACQAQLVNVIAPIRAEVGRPAWRQTIFHPFALTARFARGDVLRVESRCRTAIESATRGEVRPVDVVATRDPTDESMTIFAVNRSDCDPATLHCVLVGQASYRVVQHVELGGTRLDEFNDDTVGEVVAPRHSDAHRIDDSELTAILPPASWTMLRLQIAR